MKIPRLNQDRPLGRTAYLGAAVACLLSQHALTAAAFAVSARPIPSDVLFWLLPLTQLSRIEDFPSWARGLAFAGSVAANGMLVWLTWRRTVALGRWHELAIVAFAPVLQLFAVVAATVVPTKDWRVAAAVDDERRPRVARLAEGVLTGIGLSAAAVAVSTLIFGVYGWGVFLLTPILIGYVTAYLVNRDGPVPEGTTTNAVLVTAVLAAGSLLALALEGVVCILMASPLALGMMVLGARAGKDFALAGVRTNTRLFSVAVLPLAFFTETLLPPEHTLSTERSIEIAAPPAAVWGALIGMERIDPAPLPLFRAGLAYPTGATLLGKGVGAERVGRFSTGIARERVTAWEPGRRLAFAVHTNPPMMDELSPHDDVHAPHAHGYFDTAWTSFDIEPSVDGGVRLTLRAEHVLRVDPVLYWAPWAEWAIAANGDRVLRHVQARATRTQTAEIGG